MKKTRKLTARLVAGALRDVTEVLPLGPVGPLEAERVSRRGVRATERRFKIGDGPDAILVIVRRAGTERRYGPVEGPGPEPGTDAYRFDATGLPLAVPPDSYDGYGSAEALREAQDRYDSLRG